MLIISPSVEVLTPIDSRAVLEHLERCGRVCYKSENLIKEGSAEKFLRGIISRGHEAVLEHYDITVKFTCDRGVSHEFVRHRLASFCQESSRYCSYIKDKFGNQITVIKPCFLEVDTEQYVLWENACKFAEAAYFAMLRAGNKPEEARAVLPNSLKTELVMTANIREWRHFFKLRCDEAAHPQAREVASVLLEEFKKLLPVLFDDL